MTYSYTQISQYLTCPRRYRHRYLDGWQEKDVRAAMLFGRCFEQAVAALFRHEDPAAVLFEQWAPCKSLELVYSGTRHLGQHAPARHAVARALHPGRPRPDSPAKYPSADPIHPHVEFRQRLCGLSSMLSANWTEHLACWSGRPAPPAIRRSLPALQHWIRS